MFRVELSAVGKMYIACALLTNTHICFYKSMTSTFLDLYPPMIEHIIQLQCNMSFFKIEAIHDIHQMLCTFCKKNVKEL